MSAFALVLLLGCTAPPAGRPAATADSPAATTAGAQPAHEFTLATLDGETVALYELRGRWVIVNFWATWCAPCRDEMPYLQGLAERYPESLVVLGINMREEPALVQRFVEEMGVTFPILLGPDDAMLLAYAPRGLPLTYVIAPSGAVARVQYGPLDADGFDEWTGRRF